MRHLFAAVLVAFTSVPAEAQLVGWEGRPPAGLCESKQCTCYRDLGELTKRLSAIYSVIIDANGKYYGDYEELRGAENLAMGISNAHERTLRSCKEAGLENWVPYVYPKMDYMKFLAE